MVTQTRTRVKILDDDWTAPTADGSLAAHFEHTVAVTETGPRILTAPEGALARVAAGGVHGA
jgi:methionyl aminopeptidase